MPTPTPGRGASRCRAIVCTSALTLLIGLLAPSHVQAQTTFDAAAEQDLIAAIRQISANFARGNNAGPYTITLTADLTLTRSLPSIRTLSPGNGTAWLTIQGGGHIIDANNAGRVFVIAAGAVEINDLRIVNARASGGPGGRSSSGGAGGGGLGAGAAIFVNTGARLTTTAVIIENASAVGGPGGAATLEDLYWGGAGGGGLNGAGGDTEFGNGPSWRGGGGGAGGGGYNGTGGSTALSDFWATTASGGGAGGGGEFGHGGSAHSIAGAGGGGYEGSGADNNSFLGSGGGGYLLNGISNAGGGPEGGDPATGIANPGHGLALGGGGGGQAGGVRGGNGGVFGGGAGGGDGAGLGGFGGPGGGGGGGGGAGGNGSHAGEGGEFGGGGGAGLFGIGGQGGLGAGGGGGGGSSSSSVAPGAGGNGGFGGGGGGGGRPEDGSVTVAPGLGGTFGGNGGRAGGGGAALGGAIFVHTGGTLTLGAGYDFAGTFDATGGLGGQAVAPADNGANGEARGRVLFLTAGSNAVTLETTGVPRTIPGDDAIAGDGGLVAAGDQLLIIDGDNSHFTGSVQVTSPGGLRVGHDNAIGSGPLSIGSRLGASGTAPVTLPNAIAMIGSDGLIIDSLQSLTLAGPISGAGPLIVDSPGQVVALRGANTFSGWTIVQGGTLNIDSGGGLGASPVLAVNPGATLEATGSALGLGIETFLPMFFNNATMSVTGVLTTRGNFVVTGPLTKTGAGRLSLIGHASWGSTTTLALNGGSVSARADDMPLTIVTAPSTSVRFGQNPGTTETYDGRIRGDGGVSKSGMGTLIMTGPLSYTGTTIVNDGNLRLSAVGLPSRISVGDPQSVLELVEPVDGTFPGQISGSGMVRKTGAGTLTMTDRWSHSGTTWVQDGALQVDGTITLSIVRIFAGRTLAGSGSLRFVQMLAGSTLSPGPLDAHGVSGVGELTAFLPGLPPGSTLAIDLNGPDPGTGYDRLTGTQRVDVNAANLAVRMGTGFTPAPGAVFVIVLNINGTFAGLPEGSTVVASNGQRFKITYVGGDGNDLALTAEVAPEITGLIDRTIDEDTALGPVSFGVADDLSAADALIVSATSSNQSVVRNDSIALGGSGAMRTLTIVPVANASGTTTIAVRVQDQGGLVTQQTFVLTVNAVNDAPTITALPNQVTPQDVATSVLPFVVGDIETAADALTVSATSTNTTLVPTANVTFGVGGSGGAARTVTITPATQQSGTAVVTIIVSDGTDTGNTSFTLLVIAPPKPPDPLPTPEPPPVYYLAEGATGAFFDTDLLLANPQTVDAPVTIEFLRGDGVTVTMTRTLAPLSRMTIRLDDVPGLESTTASTRVTSTAGVPIVVERTMWWDATGYGAHTEKASAGAATEWLFAEGAQGFFSTYLLLVNPQAAANVAHVTWLRENEPALTRDYPLPPSSRVTVDASADAELVDRAFGARVVFDQPGAAERAMYFGASPLWNGGHASGGATAAATHWLLAEGATGSYFTTFVLVANPQDTATDLTFTYLPAEGSPVTRTKTLAGHQRMTVNIAHEDPSLASAAVSTDIISTQPVVVERAQYWPQPAWQEGHNSFGVTSAATTWGLAEGHVGGPRSEVTYILLANSGTEDADVTITFLRESGVPVVKTFTVAAARRFNVAIAGPDSDAPELIDESFGARIDATQPIVVERSLYGNANGITWAAGTNATATRLP